MSSVRWRLGPSFTAHVADSPAADVPIADTPAVASLPTVDPELLSVDETDEVVIFKIPPYDPSTHTPLVAIRIYFIPSGTAVEDTVDAYTGSGYPFVEKDVSGLIDGHNVEVRFPDTPAGDFVGKGIFGDAA